MFLFLLLSFPLFAKTGVKGIVSSPMGCEGSIMVWVALDKNNFQERLLLMHTQVPVGGSFQFFLNPGKYQIRASDKKGCETLQKVELKDTVLDVRLNLEKR